MVLLSNLDDQNEPGITKEHRKAMDELSKIPMKVIVVGGTNPLEKKCLYGTFVCFYPEKRCYPNCEAKTCLNCGEDYEINYESMSFYCVSCR